MSTESAFSQRQQSLYEQERVRLLYAEAPDGRKLRIGAPGVTLNAGRNAAKRAAGLSGRQRKKARKAARREGAWKSGF